jgi:hypothetical protein
MPLPPINEIFCGSSFQAPLFTGKKNTVLEWVIEVHREKTGKRLEMVVTG